MSARGWSWSQMDGLKIHKPQPRCDECGRPLDPDVAHIQHDWGCDGDGCDADCDCPEVCASCCVDPDCPLARQIPGQLTIDEAT